MFWFTYVFDATKVFAMYGVEYAEHIPGFDSHDIGKVVRVVCYWNKLKILSVGKY